MTRNLVEKTISGKKFVLFNKYPTQRGAQCVATKIRKDVSEKGYLVRVAQTPHWFVNEQGDYQHYWGVYVHDGTKKPWRKS